MTQKPYIDEALINRLFYDQPRKRFPLWQFASALILVTLGFFFALNAPAFNQQFRYWFEHDIQASQTAQPGVGIPSLSVNESPQPATSIVDQSVAQPETTLANNTLWIPKLKVKAPLIWDITATGDSTADILKGLERGVVRYPDTALPDQVGNVFLTGHSSNYWWEKGQYKTVFALLDKLVVGDTIVIQYDNVRYTYKVTGQRVIKPTETSVLAATDHATLSLMTCTPVGTNLLRRIVTADLISPTSLTKKQPSQPADNTIQPIR